MKDLIEQLREFDPKYHLFDRSHIEAADMLEQQAEEITALKAKLSAMEKQEPIGEVVQELGPRLYRVEDRTKWGMKLFAYPKVAQPLTKETIREAGGIVHGDGNIFFTNLDQLNAAIGGQSAPTVIPLTDEQIANLHRDAYTTGKAFTTIEVYHYFARAIEAAHNIGGQQP